MIYIRKKCKKIVIALGVLFVFVMLVGCKGAKSNTVEKVINVEEEVETIINEGDPYTSISKLKALLEAVKKAGDDKSKDAVLVEANLGLFCFMTGDFNGAKKYLEEAKQISEEINLDEPPIDMVYYSYGQFESGIYHNEEAIEYFNEALSWRKKIYGEDSQETGGLYIELAFSYIELDKFDEAEECINAALGLEYDEESKGMMETNAYMALGDIRMKQEDYKAAVDMYEKSREIYVDAGEPLGQPIKSTLKTRIVNALNAIRETEPDFRSES